MGRSEKCPLDVSKAFSELRQPLEPHGKSFRGEDKAFQKPKNDFPWGINKRGNVLTVTAN
jgi:hypothetical protein